MQDSRKLAEIAAQAADDKKAQRITLIDVEDVSMVTDYFLIACANSSTQLAAIAQHIEEKMGEVGLRLPKVEGSATAGWILLDFGLVVIHLMRDQEREFYNLERLWNHGRIETWIPQELKSPA